MSRIVVLFIILIMPLASSAKKPPCACDSVPKRFATAATTETKTQRNKPTTADMAHIPTGTFMMGADNQQARADELPKHKVTLSAFWLDTTTVTNAQFEKFVQATHYRTTAETPPKWEDLQKQLPPGTPKPPASKLVAASLVFTPPNHPVNLDNAAQWWTWTPGANWHHPGGPQTSTQNLAQHPVVQVSWEDAAAYCNWAGKRLPTEAEWEWAARGGLQDAIYPWGNAPIDSGESKANTWQGEFPYQNTARDHYIGTAPVKSYPPNGYGLYDMAGNVWEWVADWYNANYYTLLSKSKAINPAGPTRGYDPYDPTMPKRVLRGGSFLCNETYCTGYRVAARMKTSPDTSMQHVGFRCALSG